MGSSCSRAGGVCDADHGEQTRHGPDGRTQGTDTTWLDAEGTVRPEHERHQRPDASPKRMSPRHWCAR